MTSDSRGKWAAFKALLWTGVRQFLTIKPSDRLWQMPIAAALASGLPLLIGAWFDRMRFGLVSTLGQGSAFALIQARFVDTVLGCPVGLAGGLCLHNVQIRHALSRPMRRLIPRRLG